MTTEILLVLAGLNVPASVLMGFAVRRDFALRGRVSLPVAIWSGIAMHGHALITYAVAWLDRSTLPFASTVMTGVGVALLVLGVGLIAAGRRAYASIPRVYGLKEDELIARGVYRRSRNPQYLGYGLTFLGAALATGSAWALLLAVAFAAFIHAYIVFVEEPHLRRIFGRPYVGYCGRVSRYWGTSAKKPIIDG
jgi:protein-S-isoprenylcysteine O-methyltransferase Ste14